MVQNSNTINKLLKQFDLVNKFYLSYEQFAFLLTWQLPKQGLT